MQAWLALAAMQGATLVTRVDACDWCPSLPWLPKQPNGQLATTAVSCGGHFAETCEQCTEGHGEDWCHGQCLWMWDECILPTSGDLFIWFLVECFKHWYRFLPFTVFFGLIMLAYACAYKFKVVDKLPKKQIPDRGLDFEDWEDREVGLFECFGQPDQCLWATFCTPVVAAKNYAVGGVMGYWPACCFVWLGMHTLFLPFYCVLAVVRTSLSTKLKRNMAYETNFAVDFFTTLFCFPCEVGRESLEVNNAIGKTIECPFEIS